MNSQLREELIKIARDEISSEDVSHDFEHSFRVLLNVERLVKKEGGDLDVIIPAALFHDLIVYPKNHINSSNSQIESASEAGRILSNVKEYPKEKIDKVKIAILECSFSKNTSYSTLESSILQDADKLESTGVISIMRTFSSTGQMKRVFYNKEDPFCKNRQPNNKKYALDLFYDRLLKAKDRMNTATAKKIAFRRTKILENFLKELELELEGK